MHPSERICPPLRSSKIHLVRTGPPGQFSRMHMSGRMYVFEVDGGWVERPWAEEELI